MPKKSLKENINALLKCRASETEKEFLNELGISIKKPNKYTVIAAALYKKAASGDMTAIKEVRALIGEVSEASSFGVVKIVDDIGR